QDTEIDFCTGGLRRDQELQSASVDLFSVNAHNHVVLAKTGLVRRPIRNDVGYDCSLLRFDSVFGGKVRRQILELNSEERARHGAVILKLVHDLTNHVDGNGESYSLIAAGLGKDGGIDTDQLTLDVDQRASRVSGIDGGVGLNEVLIVFNAET